MSEQETFGFDKAIVLVKEGKAVSRVQFRDTCYIKGQFPDEHSKMTKPYLYMIKGSDKFPVDLSCESIFANDWYEVINPNA